MRVTVTGATGLIGRALLPALRARGDEVTALSRDPARAGDLLGVPVVAWEPMEEPAPPGALAGRDAVVHLAGESIAQRWSLRARRAIRESRRLGTRNLVEGLGEVPAPQRPSVLVSGSAVGYYGPRGEEPVDEEAPPGGDFLAAVCLAWEQEAHRAQEQGLRVVRLRTGVVLDPAGGALQRMLPPFRLGLGGPIGSGRQYVSWIHPRDLVALILLALDRPELRGALNGTAPEPVTNRELARGLGRVLHRPALTPVPGLALRGLYGQMATMLTSGVRALPARALVLGFSFEHPELDGALADLLGRGAGPQGPEGGRRRER